VQAAFSGFASLLMKRTPSNLRGGGMLDFLHHWQSFWGFLEIMYPRQVEHMCAGDPAKFQTYLSPWHLNPRHVELMSIKCSISECKLLEFM